jgi:hypothetical protein
VLHHAACPVAIVHDATAMTRVSGMNTRAMPNSAAASGVHRLTG